MSAEKTAGGNEQRTREVIVCADADEMNEKAAGAFIAAAERVVAAGGVFTAALSGGKTPQGLYRLLATDGYRDRIDRGSVHLFWGDERAVGPRHRESNYRMCREALLERLDMPETNIHRIKGERGEKAAGEYEREIIGFFGLRPGAFPEFSLMLLGMGADGHTASIFPGTAAVKEKERIAVYVEGVKPARITVTPPVIIAARRIIFLVSGVDKAAALFKCLEGESAPDETPAQFARLAKGPVTWFVDREAASRLNNVQR